MDTSLSPAERVGKDGKTYTVPQKPAESEPEEGQERQPGEDFDEDEEAGEVAAEPEAGATSEAFSAPASKPKDERPRDETGRVIPGQLLEAFTTSVELKAKAASLNALSAWINETCQKVGGERLTKSLSLERASGKQVYRSIHLKNLQRELDGTRPFAVCPYCEGEGCPRCSNLGWLDRGQWGQVPDDRKAGRTG